MNRLLSTLILSAICSANAWSACFSEDMGGREKPDSIYAEHGDGTVTDLETGLMWSKCLLGNSGERCQLGQAEEIISWQQALDLARDSELAGFSDWRLPNIKELVSLVDTSCSPAFNSSVFAFASIETLTLMSSTVRHVHSPDYPDEGGYSVWMLGSLGNVRSMFQNPTGGVEMILVRTDSRKADQ